MEISTRGEFLKSYYPQSAQEAQQSYPTKSAHIVFININTL